MFSQLFSIQPLPVSPTVALCLCGRGQSRFFFHGSSESLAGSAAKWVTVYPLLQLRVLMCECAGESVNVCVC